MSDKTIYDKASKVEAEKGVVDVEGPDDVDVKLTADAAAETSDRLLVESMKAHGQQFQAKKKQRPS